MVRAAIDGTSPGLQPIMRAHLELSLGKGRPVVGAELAAALHKPVDQIDRQLDRARKAMRNAIVALVLARTGQGHCPQLARTLDEMLSPEQRNAGRNLVLDPVQSSKVFKHGAGCEACGQRARQAHEYSKWALGPGLMELMNDDEERRRAALALFDSTRAGQTGAAPTVPAPAGMPPSPRSPASTAIR